MPASHPGCLRQKVAVHMLQAHTGVGRLMFIARYEMRQGRDSRMM